MVKKSLSFNEASFFLVLRPHLKSEIHPARHPWKAKTLLDLCLLLPSRLPHFSPSDLREEDQITSGLTFLLFHLQKHHGERIHRSHTTRWLPDLRSLLLSLLYRLQILDHQRIASKHPGKLGSCDPLQTRSKQQKLNQLHLLWMPALQDQETSRHTFHNRTLHQLHHFYCLQVIARGFLLDQERSSLFLRLGKMISYHMILMIGSYNMQMERGRVW